MPKSRSSSPLAIKPGEIRINGVNVFINDKNMASLTPMPPVHNLRRQGAEADTSATQGRPNKTSFNKHQRTRRNGKRYRTHPSGHGVLAPGASQAVTAALGPSGLGRVGRIVTPGSDNLSGGTHRAAGYITDAHGKKVPYGCAFDVSVSGGNGSPSTANSGGTADAGNCCLVSRTGIGRWGSRKRSAHSLRLAGGGDR